jgi:hypothetical protein
MDIFDVDMLKSVVLLRQNACFEKGGRLPSPSIIIVKKQ